MTPDGWRILPVEEVQASAKYSCVGGPFGSNLTSKDYVPEPGVPVIRGSNLSSTSDRFIDGGFVFVNEDKANQLSMNMAYPGDLLFTQRGTLGQVGQVPPGARFRRYVVSQSQMKLTPNSAFADSDYLYQFFTSPMAQRYIEDTTIATGVPHINLTILKQWPVVLPPLAEQRKIAAVLGSVDEAIGATRAVIEQTRRVKQGLLQQLLTRGIGHTRFKQTEIGEIPEGWEVVRLDDLATETKYGTSTRCSLHGGRYPVLRIPNVVSGEVTFDNLKFADVSKDDVARYSIRQGDLLIIRTNGNPAYVGRTAVVGHLSETVLYASYLIRIRVRKDRLLPDYLHFCLKHEAIRKLLDNGIRTSAGNYNLNTKGLRSVLLPIPKAAEQHKIVKRLMSMESEVNANMHAAEQLNTVKRGLMQELLTGRVRVGV